MADEIFMLKKKSSAILQVYKAFAWEYVCVACRGSTYVDHFSTFTRCALPIILIRGAH